MELKKKETKKLSHFIIGFLTSIILIAIPIVILSMGGPGVGLALGFLIVPLIASIFGLQLLAMIVFIFKGQQAKILGMLAANTVLIGVIGYGHTFGAKPKKDIPAYFFRFTSRFIHDGDEELTFDTVVACNVRLKSSQVTEGRILPGMTPNVFAKRTRNNHAVLVVTPKLCQQARYDRWDKVRKDFTPIAVWFENADELTFGLAYVSEDAYEGPKSHLKFVSAEVGPATREEWEAWWANRPENVVPQDMIRPRIGASRKDWDRWRSFWPERKYFADRCWGVIRLKLSEKSREKIRAHWPTDKPQYWIGMSKEERTEIRRFLLSEARYLSAGSGEFEFRDFWTGPLDFFSISSRTAGGSGVAKLSRHFVKPAEYYPQFRDDTYPFVASPEIDKKSEFSVRVDTDDSSNRGFFTCYNGPAPNAYKALDYYLPSGRSKPTNAYINGVKVAKEGYAFSRSWPRQYVLEEDTHLYLFKDFQILPDGGVE